MEEANPLSEVCFQIPFDRICAEHVEPAIHRHLAAASERLEAIARNGSHTRTYENTLGALDHLSDELDWALAVVRHLEAVATTPELRKAYNAVEPLAMAFYSRIPLHEGVWNALKGFAATAEARTLAGVRKRFLDKTIASFRRHGAELPPDGKKRLEEIDIELAKLTTQFGQNVLDSTNAFELLLTEEAQLAGLPESAREQARESAQRRGQEGWRFTLQQPSYLAVMMYLDDARIREKMYRAFNTRAASGAHDNRELLARILRLRHDKARLLGYPDFADFILEDRMARRGERAQEFLEDLRDRARPFFERENQELEQFRRELEGPDAPPLAPWDISYYAEKLRRARFDLDEEMLRPYFALDNVLAGLFELAGRLYGIRIEEDPSFPKWDPAVRSYRILDSDGSLLAAFYTDWFPRENKRAGAWMDSFLTGEPGQQGWKPHLGLICGNLTPPTGSKPALLTHRDVETIFHEFGHLLHHCLSRVEVRSLAGTNVAWDFVELPSQIMENWCWERESLSLFAKRWDTGEALPDDLYDRLKRARTFRAANAMMRQLSFGLLDLYLHRVWPSNQQEDVVAASRRILQEFSPAPLPEDHAMIASFLHLFSNPVGYAAAYYSYKWAEVLDADAFTYFRTHGIFSREAGLRFREQILSRGDSEDPAELFRAFLGRDPDPTALLERCGFSAV
jgi:oligopeptidase A